MQGRLQQSQAVLSNFTELLIKILKIQMETEGFCFDRYLCYHVITALIKLYHENVSL